MQFIELCRLMGLLTTACLSGDASISFSIAASRCISLSSLTSFSFRWAVFAASSFRSLLQVGRVELRKIARHPLLQVIGSGYREVVSSARVLGQISLTDPDSRSVAIDCSQVQGRQQPRRLPSSASISDKAVLRRHIRSSPTGDHPLDRESRRSPDKATNMSIFSWGIEPLGGLGDSYWVGS